MENPWLTLFSKKKKKLIDWPQHIKYIFNLNTSNNVPKKPSVYHLTKKKKKKEPFKKYFLAINIILLGLKLYNKLSPTLSVIDCFTP